MLYSNICEIFKIGVGPSSSHTMGPWRICLDVCEQLESKNNLDSVETIFVHLYGSLAKTGEGHCTPMGCTMGLLGYIPESVDPDIIESILVQIEEEKTLLLNGKKNIAFTKKENIIFHYDKALEHHANGMEIEVVFNNGNKKKYTYYSVGGGFFVREEKKNQNAPVRKKIDYPYDYSYANDFLKEVNKQNKSLYDILLENELAVYSKDVLKKNIDKIVLCMKNSVYRGVSLEGYLPGYLKVQRRAKGLNRDLVGEEHFNSMEDWQERIKKDQGNFQKTLKWISCFAISVNEENASCGKVVTAPTNGACGIIPSVLHYYLYLVENKKEKDVYGFITVSSFIASLFRARATISAAEGGCQAEVGVSSSMAAAGLTYVMGGSAGQVLEAAEIAMEHHLGLTCDPVGGLVQIPCIERNAMGAIKAITASQLALSRNSSYARVELDEVIDSMWDTSKAMKAEYKETAEGGLAIFVRNC